MTAMRSTPPLCAEFEKIKVTLESARDQTSLPLFFRACLHKKASKIGRTKEEQIGM